MRRLLVTTVAMLVFGLIVPASSAPLFPDVPDAHWAKDAVAALAAKGLVEGYPDGTFKGDRAASRWEVAMIVARLLAKMEQAHATFATKAELEEVRKLTNALREELDALGVRVTNLEEDVSLLNKRVDELERITFYGHVDTRVTFQSFTNTGLDAMRSLNPGVPFNNVDYHAAVGSAAAAGGPLAGVSGSPPFLTLAPPGFGPVTPFQTGFGTGVLPTINWQTGRPLTNGTGFTAKAVLGMRVEVTEDIEAGVEFAAYTSQGDALVDAWYGVQAPYLTNQFTGAAAPGLGLNGQSLDNTPYTRMVLDRIWVEHAPSKTKLILGAFHEQEFNKSVFVAPLNPGQFGNEHLDNYGILVDGEFAIDEDEDTFIEWQVMGTALPNGNAGPVLPVAGSQTYFSHAEGIKLGIRFHEDRGHAQFNFLHAADDASNGTSRTVGLIQRPNLAYNWVNPNGYYINQLSGQFGATGGIGSTGDIRPVPMPLNFDGNVQDLIFGLSPGGIFPQGIPNVGGIGPQDQVTFGISANYEWDNEYAPRVYGEWAHSNYRPQKNSVYTAEGDAFKIGGGLQLLNGDLDLDAHYLSVDPRFSPFLMPMPNFGGIFSPLWHTPDFHYTNNLFSLHDTKALPHNREGFRLKGVWKFRPTGRMIVEYGNLSQKQTSLQDVRFSAGALGLDTPNRDVLGYSPGWIEPLFGGYHPNTFVRQGANNLAIPLEDNEGKMQNLYFSAGHKWLLDEENNNRGVTLKGGFKWLDFERDSNMAALGVANGVPLGLARQAENQNLVDLAFVGWHVEVEYDFTETFVGRVGFTNVDIFGHFDPLNTSGLYAANTGVTRFNNVDITQTWPEIGFDWEIEEDITWGMNARYYMMDDNVPQHAFTNPRTPALNVDNGPQTAHPFNWEGYQITTSLNFKF